MQTASPDGDEPAAIEGLPRGTSVGRYLVTGRIGEGGMGVVYRAYDPDLDRSVALKLVRADQRNADRRQRLRMRLMREAQTLARLSHPNVVAVHDVGIHRDDVFVAMEFVDGLTLRRVLADESPRTGRIIELFIGAARGLVAAHAVSIVHRDFKPDNVLVSRDGEPHVSDFGLATAMHEDDELGAVLGTPAYMAPEQVAGEAVDHRADQFSFCVSLYEAFYRALPEQPPQLPARAKHGTWVPARVRAVLARGLAVDPEARFLSMAQLVRRLESRPIVRALPLIGAGFVATAIIGVVIATRASSGTKCESAVDQLAGVWDAPRRASVHAALERHGASTAGVEAMLDRYTTAWVDMHAASCRATHVRGEQSSELLDLRTECLQRHLAEVKHLTDALIVADANTAQRATAIVHALSPVEDCANTTALREPLPPRDHVLARGLRDRFSKARVEFWIGKYADVQRDTTALAKEAEQAGDRWLEANAAYLGARATRELGKPKLAEDALYRAVELAEGARSSEIAADAWMALAWTLGQDFGRTADAIKLTGVARGVIERGGGNPRLEATLEDFLGVLYLDSDSLVVARHHLERGLVLRERLYGPTDTEYAASLQHLALLEQASGQREKALDMHHRARVISEAALGGGHPEVLAMLGGEGATLYELERYQEANDLLEAGLVTVEKSVGLESELATSFLMNLGLARWKLGKLDGAKTALSQALAILERHAPEAPRAASLHYNLSLVLFDLKDLGAAKAHALQAAKAYEALGQAEEGKAAREIAAEVDSTHAAAR